MTSKSLSACSKSITTVIETTFWFVFRFYNFSTCDLLSSLQLVKVLRAYAGEKVRTQSLDLFENKNWLNVFRGTIKRGLIGVTNIFTQHVPLLEKLFTLIHENKLNDKDFPFAGAPVTRDRFALDNKYVHFVAFVLTSIHLCL